MISAQDHVPGLPTAAKDLPGFRSWRPVDAAAAHSLKCRRRDGAPCVSAFGVSVHSTVLISYLRRWAYFLHRFTTSLLPLNNFTVFNNIDFNFLFIKIGRSFDLRGSKGTLLLFLEQGRLTLNNVEVLILGDYRFNSVTCLVVLVSLHAVRC